MKRPGDKKAAPPGGRASERARLYLAQRSADTAAAKKATARKAKKNKKR